MTGFLTNLFFAACGLAGLYFGADLLVKGGVSLARRAGVPPMVIGVTLVAWGTSAPELVVSCRAAFEHNSGIALGNVVGSNICNIALILGLCSCITPLAVERKWFRLDLPVMVLSAAALTLCCLCGITLNWVCGLLFLGGLAVYTYFSFRLAGKSGEQELPEGSSPKRPFVGAALFLAAVGLGLLAGGAELLLASAVFFARLFRLSDAVIGLTVVAVGTSLPELATSLVAACKGERDIAVGNVVGSNIFNILGILGIAPLLAPIGAGAMNGVDLGMLMLCTVGLLPLMRSGWRLSRAEGALMLLLYGAYTAYLTLHHV